MTPHHIWSGMNMLDSNNQLEHPFLCTCPPVSRLQIRFAALLFFASQKLADLNIFERLIGIDVSKRAIVRIP
jgi:hypothetical protein